MNDDLESRRGKSFAQAEGVEKLPSQLERKRITPRLRSLLWDLVHSEAYDEGRWANPTWDAIFRTFHVMYLCRAIDEYDFRQAVVEIKGLIMQGTYLQYYGVLQFLLHHNDFTDDMTQSVIAILNYEMAAYRVVERTLVPITSEIDLEAVKSGLEYTKQVGLAGAHSHLSEAVKNLGARNFADTVTESINAVEAVCRSLTNKPVKLSEALGILERNGTIHGSLKKALSALYGYTSDEPGLRHCLLACGEANVDEADALLMLGSCSAVVSYILAKARLPAT